MAVTLFVVRATITKDKEAAFNKWYNEEHVPQVLQFNGAASARRYKKILGEDKFQYMAVYEFAIGYETFGTYVNHSLPALGFVAWLEQWEWALPVVLTLFFADIKLLREPSRGDAAP